MTQHSKTAQPISKFAPVATPGHQPESLRILNLPAWLYHAELDRQSCSMLKPLLLSPAHYKAQFFEQRVSSSAMALGSLVHTLVLEPHRLHQQYVVVPAGLKKSSTDFRALTLLHPGKELISELDMHQARSMAQRILERPFRGRPFGRYVEEGEPEVTFYFSDPITGVRCRSRLDLWHPEFLFDLKTTRQVGADRFVQAAVDLHYDFQAHMYTVGEALYQGRPMALPFVFVTVSNASPFTVSNLVAGPSFIENGRAKYERALALYRACSDMNYWPDDGEDDEIEIHPWQAYRAPVRGHTTDR